MLSVPEVVADVVAEAGAVLSGENHVESSSIIVVSSSTYRIARVNNREVLPDEYSCDEYQDRKCLVSQYSISIDRDYVVSTRALKVCIVESEMHHHCEKIPPSFGEN
ncbi:hypothetical protein DY000_02062801 [Brassica cretica]|uniref:Uncharacterized protein n=1 Tax=Brassica cretica TaxID=69181 RepID=A0ABQ7ARL8_BRACR|nr:hypothetical protein DY000_02062801 [Brassica cretica]